MHAGSLKTELQSWGVRLPAALREGRLGGAGPAEGVTLSLNGTVMTVPAYSPYVQESPYYIRAKESSIYLYRMSGFVARVSILDHGSFYPGVTSDGYPYGKIALVHGTDCLASTVLQNCHFWGGVSGCRFCAIGLSLQRGLTTAVKTPGQLAEVALAARQKGVNHVLLTTGSSPDGAFEIRHLAACCREIKKVAGLPVQVQCRPPADPSLLELLREAGVDSLGLHIESLDEEVLKMAAPAKHGIGWAGFLRAWSKAAALFGRGQVVSYIIIGLGENLSITRSRLRELVDLGVYPFVVPLRPIPDTPLAGSLPPPASLMKEVYEEAAGMLRSAGLSSRDIKAGCGRCPACSALPDYEMERKLSRRVVCRPAADAGEIQQALAIRRQVFVAEQGLFRDSDEDQHDQEAIHLVAEIEGRIVGTVRLYCREKGTWVGGRLAVLPQYRGRVGSLLVKRAVVEAERQGAEVFLAQVQAQNEQFFHRLGWRTAGEKEIIFGREHVPMVSPLKKAGQASGTGDKRIAGRQPDTPEKDEKGGIKCPQ